MVQVFQRGTDLSHDGHVKMVADIKLGFMDGTREVLINSVMHLLSVN